MESAVHPDRHLPGHLSPLTAPGRAAGDRSGLFGGVRGGSGQGGLQRLRPPPTGWNGRPGPTLADRWRPKPTRSTGRPGGRGPPRGIAARHGIVCFFWFWAAFRIERVAEGLALEKRDEIHATIPEACLAGAPAQMRILRARGHHLLRSGGRSRGGTPPDGEEPVFPRR